MDKDQIAELYVSFSVIFHRPNQEMANHLEEIIEFWSEVALESKKYVQELRGFCDRFLPGESRLNALWEHYIPLFETGEVEAVPYASVYFGKDGLVLGDEALKVKDFYQRCGLEIKESAELPDHLAVELEFCAFLAENGQGRLLTEFTKTHLEPFLKLILPRIIRSKRPVYSESAAILEALLPHLLKVGEYVA